MIKRQKRQVLNHIDLVRLIKDDLKEFNLSEVIIEAIVKSYVKVKRDALFNGCYINESGIGTESVYVRNVAKRFTDRGFTFKITKPLNWEFRNLLINKLKNNKDFQEIMSHNIEDTDNKDN